MLCGTVTLVSKVLYEQGNHSHSWHCKRRKIQWEPRHILAKVLKRESDRAREGEIGKRGRNQAIHSQFVRKEKREREENKEGIKAFYRPVHSFSCEIENIERVRGREWVRKRASKEKEGRKGKEDKGKKEERRRSRGTPWHGKVLPSSHRFSFLVQHGMGSLGGTPKWHEKPTRRKLHPNQRRDERKPEKSFEITSHGSFRYDGFRGEWPVPPCVHHRDKLGDGGGTGRDRSGAEEEAAVYREKKTIMIYIYIW